MRFESSREPALVRLYNRGLRPPVFSGCLIRTGTWLSAWMAACRNPEALQAADALVVTLAYVRDRQIQVTIACQVARRDELGLRSGGEIRCTPW